jgi:hypothetical protein
MLSNIKGSSDSRASPTPKRIGRGLGVTINEPRILSVELRGGSDLKFITRLVPESINLNKNDDTKIPWLPKGRFL